MLKLYFHIDHCLEFQTWTPIRGDKADIRAHVSKKGVYPLFVVEIAHTLIINDSVNLIFSKELLILILR